MLIDLTKDEIITLIDILNYERDEGGSLTFDGFRALDKLEEILNRPTCIEDIVAQIGNNHREIIEQFSKAYLAHLYEETGSINPSDVVLNSQGTGTGFRYWFTKKDAE